MSGNPLEEISADIAPFGLEYSHYMSALQRLLELDYSVKSESPVRYLDTIYEVLLRLQETYHEPLLDPLTRRAVREEANAWAKTSEPATFNIARDILNELPSE
jgi:hypothetical protein